jgi:hypothetical protein
MVLNKSDLISVSIKINALIKIDVMFRALKEEKYAARRTILPILQAEEDER